MDMRRKSSPSPLARREGALNQRHSFLDHFPVPQGAVLVFEQDDIPLAIEA